MLPQPSYEQHTGALIDDVLSKHIFPLPIVIIIDLHQVLGGDKPLVGIGAGVPLKHTDY